MQHLIDLLQTAGLSERESRVYLSALALGSATAQEIANGAQIARSTAYNVIEGLTEMGLLASIEHDGHPLFTAEPPDAILEMLKHRVEDLSRRMSVMEDALPELMALEKRQSERPRMFMFEGKEGIQRLSRRYEEATGEFFEIVPYDSLVSKLDESDFEKHKERMTHNQIRGRILIVAAKPPVEYMRELHTRYGWHVRYLPPEQAPMTGHVSVKGHEIYGVAYEGMPVGVVIENPALAGALKVVFDLAWRAA
ncbi:MAG: helix-turn-helix domain-containing protein, partial [Patescibacteria group bacterium]